MIRRSVQQLKAFLQTREGGLVLAFAALLWAVRLLFLLRRPDVFVLTSDTVVGFLLGTLLDLGFAFGFGGLLALAHGTTGTRAALAAGGLLAVLLAGLAAAETEYFAFGRNRFNASFVAYVQEWRAIAGSTGAEISPGFLLLHALVALTAVVLLHRGFGKPQLARSRSVLLALCGVTLSVVIALEPYDFKGWYGAITSRTASIELARALSEARPDAPEADDHTRQALRSTRSFIDPLEVKQFVSDEDAPLAHTSPGSPTGIFGAPERPLNVMFVVLEGLEAAALERAGGSKGLTPTLDRLAEEGAFFPNFFANGVHTPRALDAALCGLFPRLRGAPLSRAQPDLPMRCLPAILRQNGYRTAFIHGGTANFENRIEYVGNIGFQNSIFRESWFPRPRFNGGWGATDEMIYDRALEWIDGRRGSEEPYFLTVLSISNHHPWQPPDPSFVRETEEHLLPDNTIRYADHALSGFVEGLRERDVLDDTVVFLFGDHGVDRENISALPDDRAMARQLGRMNVPLIILAPPGIVPPGINEHLASQVDLQPTVLDVLGIDAPHHASGTSLGWTWAKGVDLPVFVPDVYSEKVALIRRNELTVQPLGTREGARALAAKWDRSPEGALFVVETTEPRAEDVALLDDLATSVDYLYGARRWWWERPPLTAGTVAGTGSAHGG